MVCRARYKLGRDHYFLSEMTRAMPSSFHLNNGRARVISSRTNHLALKTIPLFSKLKNSWFHALFSHLIWHWWTMKLNVVLKMYSIFSNLHLRQDIKWLIPVSIKVLQPRVVTIYQDKRVLVRSLASNWVIACYTSCYT